MNKPNLMLERMYKDPVYIDVVRTIGNTGMPYRDWKAKLQELIEKHGQEAQTASYHLLYFDGQNRADPPPLSQVMLREDIKKLAWQLLGFPPGHPDASPEPWVP